LMLQWLKQQGGVAAMYQLNQRKAAKLYQYIDSSDFYTNNIHPDYRSIMNVVFILRDETLNPLFLEEAARCGLTNLRGHRTVGGMRASIYNAMPLAGIDKLLELMADFAKQHG